MNTYTVVVREMATDKEVKRIPVHGSYDRSRKVENGVNINLNHKDYYTDILMISDDGSEVSA